MTNKPKIPVYDAEFLEPAKGQSGAWKHKPKPQGHSATSGVVFLFACLISVLISLMIAHVLVKAVANLAAFNGGVW